MEHFDMEPIVAHVRKEMELPLISSTGAGPRGKGIKAEINEDEEGLFTFSILDFETEQVLWSSPNLSPGQISVENNKIVVRKGGDVYEYPLKFPVPEPGGRIYVCGEPIARTPDGTYSVNESMLLIYNYAWWESKPPCRVNDVVFLATIGADNTQYITFGTIEAVEPIPGSDDRQVVFTARTYIDCTAPHIDEATGNWFIGPVDTGVHAEGPKGDKGDNGLTPHIDAGTGHWFTGDIDTGVEARGPEGDPGPKGDPGNSGVYVGESSSTPTPNSNVWVVTDGPPSPIPEPFYADVFEEHLDITSANVNFIGNGVVIFWIDRETVEEALSKYSANSWEVIGVPQCQLGIRNYGGYPIQVTSTLYVGNSGQDAWYTTGLMFDDNGNPHEYSGPYKILVTGQKRRKENN